MEVARKGSFPSIKVVCHLAVGGEEEEATLNLTYIVGRVLPIGSWITTAAVVGAGGVSSGLLGGWLVWWSLLQLWGVEGGCSLSWGCCCCAVGRPPGINRSSVIVLWTTISSSAFLASALEESTYLTSTCSVVGALVRYSSIGIYTSWPWKTILADPSHVGTNEPTLISRGRRSRASPIVNIGGKKPRCRTFMYDNNGLPTVKACLEVDILCRLECNWG